MARKSRKEQQLQALLPQKAEPEPVIEEASPVKWKVAMYARLSIIPPYERESDSIENQFSAITDYVSNHADMEIVDAYSDNGYSGTNFTRPGFLQMLGDMEKGKFNCLVIKDFSRLGRNYLDMDRFLNGVFPDYGVRVISILDGYDSLDGDSNAMAHAMKNILNDYFCKDSGRKIAAMLREKKSQGFFTQLIPYGYRNRSDRKGLLLMDTVTAPAVYLIFAWAESGANHTEICRYLDDLHFLRPRLQTLAERGDSLKPTVRKEWYDDTVRKILDNSVYAGEYIYRIADQKKTGPRVEPRSVNEDYAVISDHHVPYIKRCDYEVFQAQRKKSHDCYVRQLENGLLTKEREYIFYKLVYCGECHHEMQFIKESDAPSFLYCKGHFVRQPMWHQRFSITLEFLTKQVLQMLRNKQQEAETLMQRLTRAGNKQLFLWLEDQCKVESEQIARLSESCSVRRNRAESDLDNGILDRETWQMQLRVLSDEQSSLNKSYSLLQQRRQDIIDCDRLFPQALKNIIEAELSAGLSSPTVHRLIERIDIFEDMHIIVTFKNGTYFQKLNDFLAEWEYRQPDGRT